jgi:hypothetical protein
MSNLSNEAKKIIATSNMHILVLVFIIHFRFSVQKQNMISDGCVYFDVVLTLLECCFVAYMIRS